MLRHRLPGSRVTAVLLACTLGGAGTTASAAPGEPALEADPLAEAQALYDKGRAKFETADYHAAVELWTEAYALVPDTADGGQTKVLLIYNIATAREKAFEIDGELSQLREFWEQEVLSETRAVYRGEYLAASLLFAAANGSDGLT